MDYQRCGNNNKDEDNSPKNLNDKNGLPSLNILISGIKLFNTIVSKVIDHGGTLC